MTRYLVTIKCFWIFLFKMIALHLTGCINSHCLCSIQIGFKCHFSSVWQPPIHWTTFYPFLFLFRWLHWILRWYFCRKCWCFNHISVTFSHLHFLLMNLERLQLSLWCAQTCFPCCCVAALPCAPARESFHLRQKSLVCFLSSPFHIHCGRWVFSFN